MYNNINYYVTFATYNSFGFPQGAINDQGLGLVSWWTNAEEGQEEEEVEEGEEAL